MSTQTGALPEGCVLLHIGPYKTGSTAIQHSLAAHRDALEQHGVWYPGPHYRHMRPSWAVTERPMRGVDPVPITEWDVFASAVSARTTDRVVVSSEDFVLATVQQAGRIVEDLGADRVHVLLVARRLDKLVPSAWQERVKSSNETLRYDDFVVAVIDGARTHPSSQSFWSNHDLGLILDRWLPAVPAERIHVVVADEERRDQTARVFEQLLALPDGLLAPGGRANPSLSYQRVDLVRQLNEIFDERGWSDRERLTLIHRGLLRSIEELPFGATETAIPPIPTWAQQRLAELDERRIEVLHVAGLDVIGDPELLRSEASSPTGEEPPVGTLDVDVVARAIEGVVAARLQRPGRGRPAAGASAADDSAAGPTRDLVRRARRRLRRGPTS